MYNEGNNGTTSRKNKQDEVKGSKMTITADEKVVRRKEREIRA